MNRLLEVQGLSVDLGSVHPVRDVSFTLGPRERLAIVGESGCGKSLTALSLLGLQPSGASVTAQTLRFGQHDLLNPNWQALRGSQMAMIFQNPMTALNPTMRIGAQIAEPLMLHKGLGRKAAWQRAAELLEELQIERAEQRLKQYPFEFSGGMLQRVMIAQAIACEPKLLIADEPTTALDVTVQAEVLSILRHLCEQHNMALLLITHDLGVVADIAEKCVVMYAGEVVESGSVEDVFYRASHPYTQALKRAMPDLSTPNSDLAPIGGSPPELNRALNHCSFVERCPLAVNACMEPPPMKSLSNSHMSRCWLAEQGEQ